MQCGPRTCPGRRQLEAIRGAILARQSAGLPLLLKQLRSPDKTMYGIGLRTARELPGRDVTEALAAELRRCSPDRQSYLLLAIADRTDDAVLPTILQAAASGPQTLRLTAVGVLDRLGNVSSLPVLLNAASDPDAELAQAALAALARLPGNEVDADLLSRLPAATGKNRQVLVLLAGQRHIDRALPDVVSCANDSDAECASPRSKPSAFSAPTPKPRPCQAVARDQRPEGTRRHRNGPARHQWPHRRAGRAGPPPPRPKRRQRPARHRAPCARLLGGPEALAAVQAAVRTKTRRCRMRPYALCQPGPTIGLTTAA